ncbi:MAG: hypothetical protein WC503_00625 [Candidatus Shapirobacteria bacterium]
MKVKLFDELIIHDNYVRIDGKPLESILGKHCVWVAALELKIILSFQGYIESTAWQRGRKAKEIRELNLNADTPGFTMESLYSIANETRILQILAEKNMSPSSRGYAYFKTAMSTIFTKELYTDKKGMFGYYIQDANKLSRGQYNFEKFKEGFLDTGRIKANSGAIGDLGKKAGNLVNGYLVDVRRTREYMMQFNGQLDIDPLLRTLNVFNRT